MNRTCHSGVPVRPFTPPSSELVGVIRVLRHHGRSGWPSQRRWFTTWSSPCRKEAEQLLILEEDPPPLPHLTNVVSLTSACPSVAKHQVIELLLGRGKCWNYEHGLESIAKSNLMNFIFCRIFEYQFNSKTNQMCASFFWNSIFAFAGFEWLFCRYLCSRSSSLLRHWAPQRAAILVYSLPMKGRQRLARDVDVKHSFSRMSATLMGS